VLQSGSVAPLLRRNPSQQALNTAHYWCKIIVAKMSGSPKISASCSWPLQTSPATDQSRYQAFIPIS